jgi:hypothetical protein
MPRGGARPGAGRKALDRPEKPLLTYSLTLRLTDVGYLNQLGRGNLSLGLRRLIDAARLQLPPPSKRQVTAELPPQSSPGLRPRSPHAKPVAVPGHSEGTRQYG